MNFTVKGSDISVQRRFGIQRPPVNEFPFQVLKDTTVVAYARNEAEANIECLKAALRTELNIGGKAPKTYTVLDIEKGTFDKYEAHPKHTPYL